MFQSRFVAWQRICRQPVAFFIEPVRPEALPFEGHPGLRLRSRENSVRTAGGLASLFGSKRQLLIIEKDQVTAGEIFAYFDQIGALPGLNCDC